MSLNNDEGGDHGEDKHHERHDAGKRVVDGVDHAGDDPTPRPGELAKKDDLACVHQDASVLSDADAIQPRSDRGGLSRGHQLGERATLLSLVDEPAPRLGELAAPAALLRRAHTAAARAQG